MIEAVEKAYETILTNFQNYITYIQGGTEKDTSETQRNALTTYSALQHMLQGDNDAHEAEKKKLTIEHEEKIRKLKEKHEWEIRAKDYEINQKQRKISVLDEMSQKMIKFCDGRKATANIGSKDSKIQELVSEEYSIFHSINPPKEFIEQFIATAGQNGGSFYQFAELLFQKYIIDEPDLQKR